MLHSMWSELECFWKCLVWQMCNEVLLWVVGAVLEIESGDLQGDSSSGWAACILGSVAFRGATMCAL